MSCWPYGLLCTKKTDSLTALLNSVALTFERKQVEKQKQKQKKKKPKVWPTDGWRCMYARKN